MSQMIKEAIKAVMYTVLFVTLVYITHLAIISIISLYVDVNEVVSGIILLTLLVLYVVPLYVHPINVEIKCKERTIISYANKKHLKKESREW